jgi:hypothetical protein
MMEGSGPTTLDRTKEWLRKGLFQGKLALLLHVNRNKPSPNHLTPPTLNLLSADIHTASDAYILGSFSGI